MGELIKPDSNTGVSETTRGEGIEILGKVLNINKDTIDIDFDGMLNQIFQHVNIGDILQKIKVGAEYVVQVPSQFQLGLETGDYSMMENMKTGTMWPSLMEVAEDGRKHIVTPLPIKRQEFIQGNPFQELSVNYQNLYMMKQMHELAQLLECTLTSVKRIEQGQKSDRVGLLNSGKDQIMLALSQKDEASRNLALQLGRQSVSDARGQFAETLKQRVEEFEILPKSQAMLFFKEFIKKGYLQGKDEEYQEIQDYYELYLQATQILSASYAITGDLDNARKVFDLSIERMRAIDFSNLKTIEYAHKNGEIEGIYDYASEFLSTEKESCIEDAKQYDYVSIVVSGEKLLEVIDNENAEKIPEQEAE